VLILCDLDSLEIVCPRDAHHFSHGHRTFFPGQSCRLMVFAAQDGEVRGPPRLGVV